MRPQMHVHTNAQQIHWRIVAVAVAAAATLTADISISRDTGPKPVLDGAAALMIEVVVIAGDVSTSHRE